ncbi:MAG: peptidoglycan-associated lipoprotein Pal [candidate division KSB1 bacterium]|nr:peptidoglycan-associated lipoprotein Pal [candidate division KSB1 bacterium]MDZ7368800.1 peptidoglycan-associated lipoprotein Pal [candidate division KSB1 bacterium]MDZ7406610.1 peptidoglycan-associated lipoprotein Pal [candidate division KSB1 bacterium]
MSLLVWAGCSGSKKTVQTQASEEPASRVTRAPEPAAPAYQPKEETKPATESAVPFVLQTIYFDFDRYELTPEALQTLADNARVLKAHPDARVMIEGHCDERGTVEYNLALGDKRAKAAKDYLISLGVNPAQISTISYGKERPVDTRSTEEAWARNRRAEFARR